jgi:AraC-like DNA-binding protein
MRLLSEWDLGEPDAPALPESTPTQGDARFRFVPVDSAEEAGGDCLTVFSASDDPVGRAAPLIALIVDRAEFARAALRLTGNAPVTLPTRSTVPQSAELQAYWLAVCRHVYRDISQNPEAFANPLVRDSAFRTLVSAAVAAFQLQDAPAAMLPRSIRRATAFMDANAGSSMSVEDVAREARMSLRGLQYAFRRELGMTPMAYLRKVRLQRARADLVRGDLGETVRAIAKRWGYANAARFAAAYRQAFGELPGATLRS